MAINKAKKQSITSQLSEDLKNAESIVFVHFNKLPVVDSTVLRKTLHEQGISYQVVKKTLMKRVLAEKGFEGSLPELPGNIAIAWSTDPTAPAREVYAFRKGREEQVKLAGGIFENRYLDAVGINEIATIPSMHVLRGMFVNVINSPIQGFASVLNQIAEKKS